MGRRADPERLRQARRAATLARLDGEGVGPEEAERLVSSWEAQAAADGLAEGGRYWDAGWAWITAQRWSPTAAHVRKGSGAST